MDKEILDRLISIEKQLKELVEIVRSHWQTEDDKPKAATKGSFEKTARAKELFAEALHGSAAYTQGASAPDLADVYDPNERFYESENAEIDGVGVPQKGKAKKTKWRKPAEAPDSDPFANET